jgi:hypothetical protein
MTITPDLTAQILRYHHAERWPAGTISSQLNVHRETVKQLNVKDSTHKAHEPLARGWPQPVERQ